MKTAFLLKFASIALLLPACSSLQGRVTQVSYDDLGPPVLVAKALGERGANPLIVVTSGGTNTHTDPRRLNAHQAINLLRTNARQLPRTPQNEPLRQRMSVAYNRVYHLYRSRRDAALSVPPFFGRGSTSMTRMAMFPSVPPTL